MGGIMDYFNASSIENLKNVAEKWKETYCRSGVWSKIAFGDSHDIYNKLVKCTLEKPTVAKINKIIGNNSWTTKYCCECNKNELVGIIFDTGDDYYGNHFICSDCLKEAVHEIRNHNKKKN
jgi:superfamily II helicase